MEFWDNSFGNAAEQLAKFLTDEPMMKLATSLQVQVDMIRAVFYREN